jgi:hypothetical protein
MTMKHPSKTLIATVCGLAMSVGAHAATVAFEYTNPDEFRDIRATEQSQPKFEQSVLREFEDEFRDQAAKLPDGQTLHVTLTDVDLAGDIEYFHHAYPFGLRVIRDIDFPQMELSYELRDASGAVLKSGDDRIADMNFHFPTYATRLNQQPLDYERALIKQWVRETFRG